MIKSKVFSLMGVVFALTLAFQNCGKKGDFSSTAVALADGDQKSTTPPTVKSIDGEYDVISVMQSTCEGDICNAKRTVFKSKSYINLKAGNIEGKAACNKFGGQYEATVRPSEGTHLIKIKLVTSTLMACSLIDEEHLLYSALSSAYKISNSTSEIVEIYSSSKSKEDSYQHVIQLRRKNVVPPPVRWSLMGDYRVVSLSTVECLSHTMTSKSQYPCISENIKFKSTQTIFFGQEGKVSGYGACNSFFGKYELTVRAKESTDLLSIKNLVSTQKACDYLGEENALFNALSKVYKVDQAAQKDLVYLYLPTGTLVLQKRAEAINDGL